MKKFLFSSLSLVLVQGMNTASLSLFSFCFSFFSFIFSPLGAILEFWRNELLQPEQQGCNLIYFLWICLLLLLENQVIPGWYSQLARARNNSKLTLFLVFGFGRSMTGARQGFLSGVARILLDTKFKLWNWALELWIFTFGMFPFYPGLCLGLIQERDQKHALDTLKSCTKRLIFGGKKQLKGWNTWKWNGFFKDFMVDSMEMHQMELKGFWCLKVGFLGFFSTEKKERTKTPELVQLQTGKHC